MGSKTGGAYVKKGFSQNHDSKVKVCVLLESQKLIENKVFCDRIRQAIQVR